MPAMNSTVEHSVQRLHAVAALLGAAEHLARDCEKSLLVLDTHPVDCAGRGVGSSAVSAAAISS